MSKRNWLTAAAIGAALAMMTALALLLIGWRPAETRIAADLSNGMIFLGLGMVAVAGLITNVPLPARSEPAVEPSSYS